MDPALLPKLKDRESVKVKDISSTNSTEINFKAIRPNIKSFHIEKPSAGIINKIKGDVAVFTVETEVPGI